MPAVPIKVKGRDLRFHKAILSPLLDSRTVLTHSPWNFVSLWLKREGKNDALFYWSQAREFHAASSGLTLQSAPLLHYYSFMNAVKALLVAKGITFNEYHGVGADNTATTSAKINLSNERVKIKNAGILPALSSYLGETEISKTHSLQSLLFNLPYVHRTYCLTYTSQVDMYVPLTDCLYVVDTSTGEAYFSAKISKDFGVKRAVNGLPSALVRDLSSSDARAIRSLNSIHLSNVRSPSAVDFFNLQVLHTSIRRNVQYINGAQTLWYAKSRVTGPANLDRFPLTITLAAMHRLSEICRYHPIELDSFLSGQKNWLLSEFIQAAPEQFFDEIASEITGHQLLVPNVRPAT